MELTLLYYLILFCTIVVMDTSACADEEVFQSVINRLVVTNYNILTGFFPKNVRQILTETYNKCIYLQIA